MFQKPIFWIYITLIALICFFPSAVFCSSEPITLKVGVSTPLSGAGAAWGIEQKWCAEEACKRINAAGGVTIKGQKYLFEAVTYDNKYTSAEGSKVAHKLVYDDKISFVVGTIGGAPTLSLQNITEKEKILLFTTSWSMKSKGPHVPYSFEQINTPETIYPVALPALLKKFPQIKKAALLGPNDESGLATVGGALTVYKKLGIEIVGKEHYERKTPEMYPIVTKILSGNPDIVSLDGSPPGSAALILKALFELNYKGIKLWGPMPGWKMAVKASGNEVAEGLYGGLAPDFKGPFSTPIQKELAEKCERETGITLTSLGICAWDSMMAIVEAIRQTESIDSTVLRDALPNIIFESSHGPMAIGYADLYKIPRGMLLPVSISQIRAGEIHEVIRVIPEELKEKLSSAKIDWRKYYQDK